VRNALRIAHDRAVLGALDVLLHAGKVEADSLLVEVPAISLTPCHGHRPVATHLYRLTVRPLVSAKGIWLPHVGSEIQISFDG
jgi:hypothetical protein